MLVLDSGGVSRLAERSRDAEALIIALRRRSLWPPTVPSTVLVECLTGRPDRDANANPPLKAWLVTTGATCLFTVLGWMDSGSPITRLEMPVMSTASTSHSRGVRPASRDRVEAHGGTLPSRSPRRGDGSATWVAYAIASSTLMPDP